MTPRTVPEPAVVTVTATGPLTHRCPHVDEVDTGTVTVTWTTAGQTIELHSLRAWLDSFADVRTSHEAITAGIETALQLPGIVDVAVETTWTTAGMAVAATSPNAVFRQPDGR